MHGAHMGLKSCLLLIPILFQGSEPVIEKLKDATLQGTPAVSTTVVCQMYLIQLVHVFKYCIRFL